MKSDEVEVIEDNKNDNDDRNSVEVVTDEVEVIEDDKNNNDERNSVEVVTDDNDNSEEKECVDLTFDSDEENKGNHFVAF
jgi:hypothetical protein